MIYEPVLLIPFSQALCLFVCSPVCLLRREPLDVEYTARNRSLTKDVYTYIHTIHRFKLPYLNFVSTEPANIKKYRNRNAEIKKYLLRVDHLCTIMTDLESLNIYIRILYMNISLLYIRIYIYLYVFY